MLRICSPHSKNAGQAGLPDLSDDDHVRSPQGVRLDRIVLQQRVKGFGRRQLPEKPQLRAELL